MIISEFIESTGKLEKYFNKEYTSDQRKIMFDTLQKWSIKEYNRAVTYCLSNCKFLPKIADLKEGMSQIDHTENKETFEIVKCNKCSDGFVRYLKKIIDGGREIKYEYLALCNCENGKNQKLINGYNLPQISEVGL